MKLISTISVILFVIIISAGILLFEKFATKTPTASQSTSNSQQNTIENVDSSKESEPKTEVVITESELAKADGKNGNQCYVVVDNIVYSISGFVLWADGAHSPSGGRARCGKDMSSVINQSPHGKSKLSLLQKVGVYQN